MTILRKCKCVPCHYNNAVNNTCFLISITIDKNGECQNRLRVKV